MNRFNRLSALWASFYSADLYREVASLWKGLGLLYLLLLLGICWLPSAVRWHVALRELAAADAKAIVNQLPAVTITDGVMTASPAGRHVIRLESNATRPGEGLIIIDDSIERVPNDVTAEAFVLTRREAGVIRPSRGERRVWTLTRAADVALTPQQVGRFLDSLAWWVPPVAYLGAVGGSLIFRLLQAMLYGGIAIAYARRELVHLDYASAVRLAVVAITPAVVMRTLIWFGPSEPAWYVRWPVALLVTLAYLAFAVRASAGSGDVAERSAG